MAKSDYLIPKEKTGLDVWLSKPPYERKDGAKFTMTMEALTEKDLKFLEQRGIVEKAPKQEE